ncbi:MAG TPA: ATP-binding protein, partial [Thermoleophilaceae bacterium]|nr:ATP-binding protein [Thermoleophilaceae bacterium]
MRLTRADQQLLEREAELAQLEATLAGAPEGEGRLIVLEAAAGLGKTRLVEAAIAQAEERRMIALTARGTELERDYAFGVVHQLFEPAIMGAGERGREALFGGAAALARPLFETPDQPRPAPPDPAFATLHGLYWLLANLASERPLLLALDDAQWADGASLRFLSFLLPRLAELPLALLVALRTAEPGSERPE